jgi:hypothetical protein
VLWFLFCFGPRSCRAITTAPTWEGVRDLLWAEIAVACQDSLVPLGFQPNVTDLRLAPDWFAKGLSTDVPERFQGHHADHLFLVMDEASGVHEAIYRASKGFLTGGHNKVLLIGNPTRTKGSFFNAFSPNRKRPYKQIHLSMFHSPNLTGEVVSEKLAHALPSQDTIDEFEDDYGADSGEFAIRVLGEFCDTSGLQFFNRKHLARLEAVPPVRRGELDPESGAWVATPAGRLWVWEPPLAEERYVVAIDPAGLVTEAERELFARPEDAGDDVCIQVLAASDGRQVAEFLGRIDPDHAGRTGAWLGDRYNRAVVSVEKQGGYGDAPITELRRVGYGNLFYRTTYDRKRQRQGQEIGWTTTRSTRPRMLDTARRVLRDEWVGIRSERLQYQLRKFVINALGNPEADEGEHDDSVMCWAQGCEVRRQRFEKGEPMEEREARESLEERAMRHGPRAYAARGSGSSRQARLHRAIERKRGRS